jgi:carbamoyltransferase
MRVVHKNRPNDLYQFLVEKFKPYRFDSIAGGVQKWLEEMSKELMRNIYKETGIRNFVFSGGVAMNVKLSQTLSELEFVDDFFVCGSSSDESLSIGGCYFSNHLNQIKNQPLENLYLGPKNTIKEINEWIEEKSLFNNYRIEKGVANKTVAEKIAKGEIVARVAGNMEFGARALGNRSILANPSNSKVIKIINEMIKGRDFWMPFGLTILDKYADKYLYNPKQIEGRYMAMCFHTKAEFLHEIWAGTHPYDNTVRPQILNKEQNSSYYDLIDQFSQITGIGAILNTSFNLHGFPIVMNVSDAFHVFENSGLDHLLIENILISKK